MEIDATEQMDYMKIDQDVKSSIEVNTPIPDLVKNKMTNLFENIVKENYNKSTVPNLGRPLSYCLGIIEKTSIYLANVTKSRFSDSTFDDDVFYYQLLVECSNFSNVGKFSKKEQSLIRSGFDAKEEKLNKYCTCAFMFSNIFRKLKYNGEPCDHSDTNESKAKCYICVGIKGMLSTLTKEEEFLGNFFKFSEDFYDKYSQLIENLNDVANCLSKSQATLYGAFLSHLLRF